MIAAERLGRTGGSRLEGAIEAVMTPGVVCLDADAPLLDAVRSMDRHRVHAIVVLGQGQTGPIGLVTSIGVLPWLDRDLDVVPVRAAITEAAVSVMPGTAVAEVVAILRESTCGHVLVSRTPQQRPDGIVSALDVLHLMA
jgi:CBS domain-containing protein